MTKLSSITKTPPAFRVGDTVKDKYGRKGVVVDGETGVFSVKYGTFPYSQVIDVDEDEARDYKKVGKR
jgi:hypothetical protein